MKVSLLILSFVLTAGSLWADEALRERAKVLLPPIPKTAEELNKLTHNPKNPMSGEKIELGKMLYFEPRLSKSGFISCNSCHNLGLGGVDGIPAAVGHKWTTNPHHLNSPTVYNAVFHAMQFWDGRSPDLEDQAQGPIQAGPEMAAPKELVVNRLKSIPEYVQRFQEAFPGQELSFENAANAIAAFERTLVTPSRFDDFMHGDDDALSAEEKKGLKFFLSNNCTMCHNGVGIGGAMKMMFPMVKPFEFANVGDFNKGKPGLVKVPGLRNIRKTAPYFHNGTVWDLKKTVKIMGETQLGKKIPEEEVDAIVAFLGALDGRLPEISYPELPASTLQTTPPSLD